MRTTDKKVPTIEAIMDREAATRKKDELTKLEIEELRIAINSMASSEHGLVVFKRLVKMCCMYQPMYSAEPNVAMCDRAKQSIYCGLRLFLSEENRLKVERQG